jgi:hypothetical protein
MNDITFLLRSTGHELVPEFVPLLVTLLLVVEEASEDVVVARKTGPVVSKGLQGSQGVSCLPAATHGTSSITNDLRVLSPS